MSFSNPGFYAVIDHVKRMKTSPGHAREPIQVEDWTALLERPVDFRGLPVTIEGVVGRKKSLAIRAAGAPTHRHGLAVGTVEHGSADCSHPDSDRERRRYPDQRHDPGDRILRNDPTVSQQH